MLKEKGKSLREKKRSRDENGIITSTSVKLSDIPAVLTVTNNVLSRDILQQKQKQTKQQWMSHQNNVSK